MHVFKRSIGLITAGLQKIHCRRHLKELQNVEFDLQVEEYFKQPIVDTFDVRILVAKSTKHRINFMGSQEEDLHRIEIPLRFVAHSSATVHGLAFWFDVAFIGSA